MKTSVALLRGVNVGGHRIRMPDLVELFGEAGCEDVKTYVQSGNVVFRHNTRSDRALIDDLEQRMKAAYGFDVPVILRHQDEWQAVLDANPYPTDDATTVHVIFLATKPPGKALDAVDRTAFEPEEFTLNGREIYLHLPEGMGRSKLPPKLVIKGVMATARNWRSVTKLAELAQVTSR
jgi:uncharacterized protein (DUF1697 family)